MIKFISMLFLTTSLYSSAGAPHEPSIKDLIYPSINAVIFFSVVIFSLKGALRNLFNKMSLEVSALIDEAAVKDKEADIKLKKYQEKLDNFDNEVIKIEKESADQIVTFKNKTSNEAEESILRYKKDSMARLDGEIQSLENEFAEQFVDKLIDVAKEKVSSNKDIGSSVTKNLVSSLN
ncbi:MAG: hypothetical protein H6622_03405 [Halobacteriovoraceae bacterium]|nr:hypothetical protein [Halobacteriovoraceae bacterium]